MKEKGARRGGEVESTVRVLICFSFTYVILAGILASGGGAAAAAGGGDGGGSAGMDEGAFGPSGRDWCGLTGVCCEALGLTILLTSSRGTFC